MKWTIGAVVALSVACTVNLPGDAVYSCKTDSDCGGGGFSCVMRAGSAAGFCCQVTDEVCDNQDNNCDGVADEGFNLATDPMNCGTCGNVCPGTCSGARCLETSCADGMDNDGDGTADCGDPDCAGKACDDHDGCTSNDTCAANVCRGTAGCTTAPTACFTSPGTCAGQSCSYVARPQGFTCTDNDACTVGDACNGDGGCLAGPARTCANPPGECFGTGSCVPADGGCSYAITAGAPCDGGACTATGICLPAFVFAPSNFDLANAPPTAGNVLLNCGVTTFNSGPTGMGFTNWCAGQPQPTPVVVQSDAGVDAGLDAVLLAMRDLTVGDGGQLRLTGARPVIIVAYGDVTVMGHVRAGAAALNAGAGGSSVACGASNGAAGAATGVSPGGGGAGFGSSGGDGGMSGTAGVVGGIGGAVGGNAALTPLRGGCSGGRGGNSGGLGGAGGGALQISAARRVRVSGTVSAAGGGGQNGASNNHGAGGGGSAGAVLLEGASIVIEATGKLTANGGSGGEGDNSGRSGVDGDAFSATVAPGGSGGSAGAGNGGNGGAGTIAPTDGQAGQGTSQPGGGGGGAVGRIRLNSATGCTLDAAALLSPPATSNLQDAGCP